METMKERIATVQRLRQDHGGYEAIPEEALQTIDYIRYIDEEGVVQVTPAEVIAQRSLARSIDRREKSKPLFDVLQLEIHSYEAYATTVPPNVFIKECDAVFEEIDAYWNTESELRDALYLQHFDIARSVYDAPAHQDRSQIFSWPQYDQLIEAAMMARRGKGTVLEPAMVMRDYLQLSEADERYGSATSENIWEGLERTKSALTDPEILDQVTREQYGVYINEYTDEDGTDIPAYHARLAGILRAGGIETAAAQLESAQDIDEARAVVRSALESNSVVDDLKKAEKDLKTQMRVATSDDERHAINRQIHGIRAQRKTALQIVHGVDAVLHPAEAYARYIKSRIEKLQAHFVNDSEGIVTLTFDGKPDAEKDKDPGRMSGDCTEGKPLPFDKNVGAHNVKVELDGRYVGNVYVLDTKDTDGNHVWHLDAIQIPTVRVDWQSTIDEVVDTFAVAAQEHDVSMITINERTELISNYDYIGDAALELLSTLKLEGLSKTVDVVFPDSFDDTTDFQGKSCQQRAVWLNQR